MQWALGHFRVLEVLPYLLPAWWFSSILLIDFRKYGIPEIGQWRQPRYLDSYIFSSNDFTLCHLSHSFIFTNSAFCFLFRAQLMWTTQLLSSWNSFSSSFPANYVWWPWPHFCSGKITLKYVSISRDILLCVVFTVSTEVQFWIGFEYQLAVCVWQRTLHDSIISSLVKQKSHFSRPVLPLREQCLRLDPGNSILMT